MLGCVKFQRPKQTGGLMTAGSERRTSRRFNMSLPLVVRFPEDGTPADATAETRDISFKGLYFTLDKSCKAGSNLEFVLTLPREITMAGDVQIRCMGEVIRVDEKQPGKCGIAARIDKYDFLPRPD